MFSLLLQGNHVIKIKGIQKMHLPQFLHSKNIFFGGWIRYTQRITKIIMH